MEKMPIRFWIFDKLKFQSEGTGKIPLNGEKQVRCRRQKSGKKCWFNPFYKPNTWVRVHQPFSSKVFVFLSRIL